MRVGDLPPPPPPPSGERSGRSPGGSRPVCKYGKACYQKNAAHRAAFAHPWDDEPGSTGSPSTSPTTRQPRSPVPAASAASAMNRLNTPPRENDLLPPSSTHVRTTPRRDRSPRPGKACTRRNPEHFETFDHTAEGDDDGPGTPRAPPPAAPPAARRHSPRPFEAAASPRPKLDYRSSDTPAAAKHSADGLRSGMDEAFSLPTQPSAPASPSAGAASRYDGPSAVRGRSPSPAPAASYGGGSYGGSKYVSSYATSSASSGPSTADAAAKPSGAPAPPKLPRKFGVEDGDKSPRSRAAGGDGDDRWGHTRNGDSRHGGTKATYAGGSYGGASYSKYGGSSGPVSSGGGPSYSAAPSRSLLSRGFDKSDADKSDFGSKFGDALSSMRDVLSSMRETASSSTDKLKNMKNVLGASVGFIWTLNAILLFAAIVKIAQ